MKLMCKCLNQSFEFVYLPGWGHLARPIRVGWRRYTDRGDLMWEAIAPQCEGCPNVKEAPGGRGRWMFCAPPGLGMAWLSARRRRALEDALMEAGHKFDDFIIPASVHGASKIIKNQGIAFFIEEADHD